MSEQGVGITDADKKFDVASMVKTIEQNRKGMRDQEAEILIRTVCLEASIKIHEKDTTGSAVDVITDAKEIEKFLRNGLTDPPE